MELHFIIEPFSVLWWTGIIGSICISVGLIQLAIRIPPDKRRLIMISIGLLQIGCEIWRQWYLTELGIWSFKNSLPLHLCGITSILAGIMMIRSHQLGFEFLALIGIPSAIHSFLTPELVNGGDMFQIVEYYISHGGIILITFYLAIVEGYRLRENSWKTVFMFSQILLLVIVALNYVLNSNYMFICQKPLANNPLIIGEWPWYILGFEIAGIIHILLFYMGFRKLKPLPF